VTELERQGTAVENEVRRDGIQFRRQPQLGLWQDVQARIKGCRHMSRGATLVLPECPWVALCQGCLLITRMLLPSLFNAILIFIVRNKPTSLTAARGVPIPRGSFLTRDNGFTGISSSLLFNATLGHFSHNLLLNCSCEIDRAGLRDQLGPRPRDRLRHRRKLCRGRVIRQGCRVSSCFVRIMICALRAAVRCRSSAGGPSNNFIFTPASLKSLDAGHRCRGGLGGSLCGSLCWHGL